MVRIDWQWLAADGAVTKVPLGGEKIGANLTDHGKGGNAVGPHRRERYPHRDHHRRRQPPDQKLLEATLERESDPAADTDGWVPAADVPGDAHAIRELLIAHGFVPYIRSIGQEVAEKERNANWQADS